MSHKNNRFSARPATAAAPPVPTSDAAPDTLIVLPADEAAARAIVAAETSPGTIPNTAPERSAVDTLHTVTALSAERVPVTDPDDLAAHRLLALAAAVDAGIDLDGRIKRAMAALTNRIVDAVLAEPS